MCQAKMISLLLMLNSVVVLGMGSQDPNMASCTTTPQPYQDYSGESLAYDIQIGRPFIAGAGCAPVQTTLNQGNGYANPGIGNYTCVEDGFGGTRLGFLSGKSTDRLANLAIILQLQAAYPMVPFKAKRICLMDGVPAPDDWPKA